MNEVQAKRQSVVITKRGKPVAKLVPVEKKRDDIFGFLKGKIKVTGDVVAPAFTPEEWAIFIDPARHARGRLAGIWRLTAFA